MAFFVGLIAATVVDPLSVRLNRSAMDTDQIYLVDDSIWLHEQTSEGRVTIRAKSLSRSSEGLVFSNVIALVQNSSSHLEQRVESPKLLLSGNVFSSGSATVLSKDGTISYGRKWSIDSVSGADKMMERYLKPEQVSFWRLPGFIRDSKKIGIEVPSHAVRFWTLLFLPISLLAMTVLGFAFAQTHERRNYSFGIKFSIGVLVSFILYFTTNLFGALGASGTLPAMLSVLTPPMIIIVAASIFIVSFDSI
jgi:lipopolysaccharide export system permease protein